MENLYEMMLIAKSDLDELEEKKVFSKISEIIGDKGKIKNTSNLGKRVLSYRIKKENEGNYWVLDLELDPTEVNPVSAKFSMVEGILRFLILKKVISHKVAIKDSKVANKNKSIIITKEVESAVKAKKGSK